MNDNIPYFAQLPQELDLKTDDLDRALLPNLLLMIPWRPSKCEANEISIERHLDEAAIEHKAAIKTANWNGINRLFGNGQDQPVIPFLQEIAAEIKEQSIQQDITELGEMVQEVYLKQLVKLGIRPADASTRVEQVIEVDFTMLDLYPGDTQIHYKLYTKRELRLLEAV